MAVAPIHGWDLPDDTDPVAQGAAAIRSLGLALDSRFTYNRLERNSTLSQTLNTPVDVAWLTNATQAPYLSGGTPGSTGLAVTRSGLYLVQLAVNAPGIASGRYATAITVAGGPVTGGTSLVTTSAGNTHSIQSSAVVYATAGQAIGAQVTSYGALVSLASAVITIVGGF